MAIIPDDVYENDENGYIDILDKISEDYPTKTYKINPLTNQIEGYCDGLEAMKQAFNLQLNTQRYRNFGFSNNYGMEWQDLIGKSEDYIISELIKRLKDMIKGDKRYTNVDLYSDEPFTINGDRLIINIVVETIYGSFDAEVGIKNE